MEAGSAGTIDKAAGETSSGAPGTPLAAGRLCEARWLGRIGYREALDLQEQAARALKDAQLQGSKADECLLLLEHPPVITLGRNAVEADVLAGTERLAALGVTVEKTNRGGQVTYHGPGQLVGYPILDLNPDRRDVGRYLRDLEEALIRTLATYGIVAGRSQGATGVWVGDAKIAAIGVHLSRWVTTHGFALNVTTDLDAFSLIVPCGLRTRGVTSMQRLLGRPIDLEEVARRFVPEFAAIFGRDVTLDGAAVSGAGAAAEGH
jgi:lipoyl(octanoyl) transferase